MSVRLEYLNSAGDVVDSEKLTPRKVVGLGKIWPSRITVYTVGDTPVGIGLSEGYFLDGVVRVSRETKDQIVFVDPSKSAEEARRVLTGQEINAAQISSTRVHVERNLAGRLFSPHVDTQYASARVVWKASRWSRRN